MADFASEILEINLEDEMRRSYLDYAMSVIIGRALPDVRDGLKPVHRRVLYAMNEVGNDWNKPYKKSARIVGDVMGKYHPHGDTAIYDTIVRMAQPFSLRYMLVDGQGNFGSVDGDAPAAMRYTEIRMSKIAHQLLADIDKDTVDFVPNYDESEHEPNVLPTRVPNLLINGSTGIAVGMATNIPPHNLAEVINACIALIENPGLTVDELMGYLPGPDFPTAALINGSKGIREAYHTGRGRIYVRARCVIEDHPKSDRQTIIVNELPYQVNKARLLEKIAELVKEKKIEGVSGLRDESDKDGMRMVIELRRGEVAEVVLNNLYRHTQLQTVYGINMVALIDGRPRLLNLKELLSAFIRHRREVVTRRTIYELNKARERAHILEGLAVALVNLDEIIELIKRSPTPAAAKEGLIERIWRPGDVMGYLERTEAIRPPGLESHYGLHEDGYRLSPTQAQAILDLRLHRLTGLEQDKILSEFNDLLVKVGELLDILGNVSRLLEVIRDELTEIRDQFGDQRRTEIVADLQDLTMEDLITEEDVVVTLSHTGYVKAQPVSDYQAQKRGGRGKAAAKVKEEDFIDQLFIASTHDTLLCFSDRGRMYWLKVYDVPQAGRGARGRPIVNMLPLQTDERITALMPIREYSDNKYIFMATSSGTVKKSPLKDFSRPRPSGLIAVDLKASDHLIGVAITDGEQDVMLFTNAGKAIRFAESDVRVMGRNACGVRGIKLPEGQRVISLIAGGEGCVLIATENGFGKRTRVEQFSRQGRGGQGVIAIQTNERNGDLVAAIRIEDDDELILITNGGTLVRTRVAEVSVSGRTAQGVKLISLGNDEKLVGIEKVAEESQADNEYSEDGEE